MTAPPRILTIAGSDSSGGAGIQADLKTITAQNTLGVTMVEALSPAMVAAQIDACTSDVGVDAVKIGMLGSPEIAAVVADRLAALAVPVVFDPVMIATSGAALADAATIAGFERLMQLATLTTPNVPELEALGGHEAMQARGVAYLAKGGDAEGERVEDVLVLPGEEPHVMAATRIHTRHTHGTGCTLSSAIATYLGKGMALPEAVDRARLFVRSALRAAPGFGQGSGPLGHAEARG